MTDDLIAAQKIASLRAATLRDIEPGLARLPEHLRDGLRDYVMDGRPVGGFLTCVIENDLLGAVCRADDTTALPELRALARFLYNDAPGPCWGSAASRKAWQAGKGVAGLAAR